MRVSQQRLPPDLSRAFGALRNVPLVFDHEAYDSIVLKNTRPSTVVLARFSAMADHAYQKRYGTLPFQRFGFGDLIGFGLSDEELEEQKNIQSQAAAVAAGVKVPWKPPTDFFPTWVQEAQNRQVAPGMPGCDWYDVGCWVSSLRDRIVDVAKWMERAASSAAEAINFRNLYEGAKTVLRQFDITSGDAALPRIACALNPVWCFFQESAAFWIKMIKCLGTKGLEGNFGALLDCFTDALATGIKNFAVGFGFSLLAFNVAINVASGNLLEAISITGSLVAGTVVAFFNNETFRKTYNISESTAKIVIGLTGSIVHSIDLFRYLKERGAEGLRDEVFFMLIGGIVAGIPGTGRVGKNIAINADIFSSILRGEFMVAAGLIKDRYIAPIYAPVIENFDRAIDAGRKLKSEMEKKSGDISESAELLRSIGGLLIEFWNALNKIPILGKLTGFLRSAGEQLVGIADQFSAIVGETRKQEAQAREFYDKRIPEIQEAFKRPTPLEVEDRLKVAVKERENEYRIKIAQQQDVFDRQRLASESALVALTEKKTALERQLTESEENYQARIARIDEEKEARIIDLQNRYDMVTAQSGTIIAEREAALKKQDAAIKQQKIYEDLNAKLIETLQIWATAREGDEKAFGDALFSPVLSRRIGAMRTL